MFSTATFAGESVVWVHRHEIAHMHTMHPCLHADSQSVSQSYVFVVSRVPQLYLLPFLSSSSSSFSSTFLRLCRVAAKLMEGVAVETLQSSVGEHASRTSATCDLGVAHPPVDNRRFTSKTVVWVAAREIERDREPDRIARNVVRRCFVNFFETRIERLNAGNRHVSQFTRKFAIFTSSLCCTGAALIFTDGSKQLFIYWPSDWNIRRDKSVWQ